MMARDKIHTSERESTTEAPRAARTTTTPPQTTRSPNFCCTAGNEHSLLYLDLGESPRGPHQGFAESLVVVGTFVALSGGTGLSSSSSPSPIRPFSHVCEIGVFRPRASAKNDTKNCTMEKKKIRRLSSLGCRLSGGQYTMRGLCVHFTLLHICLVLGRTYPSVDRWCVNVRKWNLPQPEQRGGASAKKRCGIFGGIYVLYSSPKNAGIHLPSP